MEYNYYVPKFRAKRLDNGEWMEGEYVHELELHYLKELRDFTYYQIDRSTLSISTGLHDDNSDGVELFQNDICEFPNGDRFYIDCENWLELAAVWIGEPECEDQLRDFWRISRSKKIGNVFDNQDLLTPKEKSPIRIFLDEIFNP